MQNTSPIWKWLWADGGKNLPSADYSGAVASFENPGYAYPKQITVDIIPVQSGSGDPSPENVRPIIGWTGAKVTVSPSQNAQDGTIYDITFPTEAGTVYGGTLDVTNGTLVVDRVSTTIMPSDISNINIENANPNYLGTIYFALKIPYPIKYPTTTIGTTPFDGECSVLSPFKSGDSWLDNIARIGYWYARVESPGYAAIRCKIPGIEYTLANVQQALNGCQIVYPLATPQTYQLSPTQIALLAGMNNVWADCGDIAVSLESPRDVKLETEAIIAGVEYTDITAPVINRALMQGGLSIGNAVSATCSFSVRNPGTIPKSAEVVIQKRLTDGTQTSEWITCGTFYVSHRQRDPVTGTLELECYDALLKANADMPALMPWTTKDGEPMRTASGEMLYFSAHYPRTMAAVMDDIALILGGAIRIDPATQIETGAAYTIDEMQRGTRIVDVLRKIAAANGGNWIMTPENTLRLVPVISAAGAASATANVVDVDGVVGGIGVSNTGTITGIRYTADGGQQVAGDESGIVLDADVSATVAQALLTKLGGMTYQAYTLSGAVYDPAAELGDYIRAGANGEVSAVIYAETATLGPAFRGNVSAPEIGELADEYPYVGSNAQLLTLAQQYADEAAQQAETNATAAAQEAVTTLDNSLTQQEIFDRLTNDGQEQGISLKAATNPGPSAETPKKLFLNVDFVDEGTMTFDHLKGNVLTLGGNNNTSGLMEIYDASGNKVGTLDNTKFLLGVTGNYVQLYGPATYNGAEAITPFYAIQTYGTKTVEMMLKQAMLVLLRGTLGVQINPDSISLTENSGSGYEAYLDIARGYIEALGGDLELISDTGDLNLVGNRIKVSGTPGVSGTFTTANGKTVTVTKGLITAIA